MSPSTNQPANSDTIASTTESLSHTTSNPEDPPVAVVTGAGGGMGACIADRLLAQGASVVAIDRKPCPVHLQRAGAGCHYLQADLTDADFHERQLPAVLDSLAHVDYLVNAAGVLLFDEDRGVVDVDLVTWDRVFDVNLRAAARMVRACIPRMRLGTGRNRALVHIATIQCYRGDDRPQDAYQASKAGLIALSKSLAIQYAGEGIRSNVIAPGMIDTPLQARWRDDTVLREATARHVPLQRIGTPDDIANACLFLLGPESAYITGTELVVDGGLLAKPG